MKKQTSGMVGDNRPDRYCRDLCSGGVTETLWSASQETLQPNGFASAS